MDTLKIREYIAKHREQRKLKQVDVAVRAKLSRELISRFENGQDISISRLLRICDALGLEVDIRPVGGRPTLEELGDLFAEDE